VAFVRITVRMAAPELIGPRRPPAAWPYPAGVSVSSGERTL
jgi:hypothetical protein